MMRQIIIKNVELISIRVEMAFTARGTLNLTMAQTRLGREVVLGLAQKSTHEVVARKRNDHKSNGDHCRQ